MSDEREALARVDGWQQSQPWPDPTPEMLESPMFEAIWQAIKTWDISVPGAYAGRCGATGNHVRAIMEAAGWRRSPQPADPREALEANRNANRHWAEVREWVRGVAKSVRLCDFASERAVTTMTDALVKAGWRRSPQPAWRPIENAPMKTPVLLLLKDPIPVDREDLRGFDGLQFVGRRIDEWGWNFAAPVGVGGFPDEWFVGWQPLPGEQPQPADLHVAEIRARLEAAKDMIFKLSLPRGSRGAREWVMSIPARPDHDPDLVIMAALADAENLLSLLGGDR